MRPEIDIASDVSSPVERSLAPDVDVGDREDDYEKEELDEAEPRELVEDHSERIQEDDLDIEDDEEHRRQVEADREAGGGGRPERDAGLERQRPGTHAAVGPGGQRERGEDHREWDREREEAVD